MTDTTREVPTWHRTIPSLITVAGLVCGIVGALMLPSLAGVALLLLSLALDVLDGWAARRLGAVSRFGAALVVGGLR